MATYLLNRLLLIIPTLLGILMINFLIINAAPGGPIDYVISRMQNSEANEGMSGIIEAGKNTHTMDDEALKKLTQHFHFDKPLWWRFTHMVKNYLCFDFGESYFKKDKVSSLIISRIPVSLSLGLWSTLLIYLISIPLGIMKAVRNGSKFDAISSALIILGYATPGFLMAIILIVFFAGGSFWSFFPLRGLTSSNWGDLSAWAKVKDYFWHMGLPILSQVITGFAALTLMTKNAFLEEIKKGYVITARAMGFTERAILLKFIFRNAMLVIIAGLPSVLLGIFFSGSFLIESIFSLDGLGLLSYEAIGMRDYPIIFGSLYLFSLSGLLMHLLSDWLYTLIDPRITYKKG